MNTVFKLSYQAWLLLGIGGSFSLYWFVSVWAPSGRHALVVFRGAGTVAVAFVLAGALLYPLGATLSRTDGFARPDRTLNGLAHARGATPDDIAVADWLRRRAGPDERIVEAVGGQYSAAGRISAWTGVPSVLGWPGHERQWGRDPRVVGAREADVDLLYRTESLAEAIAILQKYDVTYVFIGRIERATYPAAGLEKFENSLPSVLRNGTAALYRVLPEGLVTQPAVLEEGQ
jgi:uncharacterized membrane protein